MEEINLKTLADRLKYVLAMKHMSQSELARRAGLRPQSIQHLCSGKARKTRYATEIARVLGIRTDWLLTGQGPMIDSTFVQSIEQMLPYASPKTYEKLTAIAEAARTGRLTEEDIELLSLIAKRLEEKYGYREQ